MTQVFQERALRFGRSNTLVGVVSEPAHPEPYAKPAMVFLNSGIIHRVGANRIYVRLARALANNGVASLRFDLSGIGDSELPADAANVSLGELVRRDIDDALAHLESRGADRFVLAGLCSGADNALEAVGRDDRIVGALLMDPFAFHTLGYYLRYYGRRVLRPHAWWTLVTSGATRLRGWLRPPTGGPAQGNGGAVESAGIAASTPPTKQEMIDRLETLVDRGVNILYAFTAGIEQRYNYENQFFDAFPGVDFQGRVRLEYFADSDHMFSPETAQDRLEELVVDWFQACWQTVPRTGPKAVERAAVAHRAARSRESPAL